MTRWEIDVQIDEQFEEKVDESWASGVIEKVLEAEGVPEGVEVDLFVTTDDEIRDLNRTYRGLDEPTDVLSFALSEEEGEEPVQFLLPPGTVHLGEVIISYETAERQAAERNLPVDHEIALLLVHGVLHLLGYDHAESDEEAAMRAKEQTILSEVRLSQA